ncbi:hypothetical protein [Paenibacillus sp. NPDC057967]|uniref:hypothetical protein n=1 Tax=Paenibacillus sp. NPDC057967 TaxID=3346293 RepID=UPI0036DCB3E8
MNEAVTAVLMDIQREIAQQIGAGVDVHYSEGKGALFVPEGAALTPDNVIYAEHDMSLRIKEQLRRMSA